MSILLRSEQDKYILKQRNPKLNVAVFGNIPASISQLVNLEVTPTGFQAAQTLNNGDIILPDGLTYVSHVITNTGVPVVTAINDSTGELYQFTSDYKHSFIRPLENIGHIFNVGKTMGTNRDLHGFLYEGEAASNLDNSFNVISVEEYTVQFGLESYLFHKLTLSNPVDIYVSGFVTDTSSTGHGLKVRVDDVLSSHSTIYLPMDIVRAVGAKASLSTSSSITTSITGFPVGGFR